MKNSRTVEDVREEIAEERRQLVGAVTSLRAEMNGAKAIGKRIKVPLIAGAALVGFVLAGGVGATFRLFAIRSRRRHERKKQPLFRLFARK